MADDRPPCEARGACSGRSQGRAWATLFLIAACALPARAIPAFDEVRQDFRPSETQILSREGEVLQRLRTDTSVRRGQWVPLADVSPALRTALVLIAGVDGYLLQSLANLAKISPSLADDAVFLSELSIGLYVLPLVCGGIGVNLISHVLLRHLGEAEARFEKEHPGGG